MQRIPAQTIRDQYAKRTELNEKWVLKHESKVLANLQATMSELDTYRDRVIAFEAVKATDASRLVSTRQPLQPKSPQALSPSSDSNPTQSMNTVLNVKCPPTDELATSDEGHDENRVPQSRSHAQESIDQSRAISPRPQSNPITPSMNDRRNQARDTEEASPWKGIDFAAGVKRESPSQASLLPDQPDDKVGVAGFNWFRGATIDYTRSCWPNLTEGKSEFNRFHRNR